MLNIVNSHNNHVNPSVQGMRPSNTISVAKKEAIVQIKKANVDPQRTDPVIYLSEDSMLCVMAKLPLIDLLVCSQVSKRWKVLSEENDLWNAYTKVFKELILNPSITNKQQIINKIFILKDLEDISQNIDFCIVNKVTYEAREILIEIAKLTAQKMGRKPPNILKTTASTDRVPRDKRLSLKSQN